MMAVAVRFRRIEDGPWEPGIGISREDEPGQLDVIIDRDGKIIDIPWDYNHYEHYGCMVINMHSLDWNVKS